jgi:hypothetical protein
VRAAQYWQRVDHADPRALDMADRHYSRQSPGTPEFIANGNKIALLHFAPDGTPAALWASHRPAPEIATRPDGRDVWACTLFRIEQPTIQASALIREAVAITKGLWAPLPADGFYTTVDPRKVRPIKRRGRDLWGYCYIKAGWVVQAERTKRRDLVILLLPPGQLAAVESLAAPVALPPFGIRWRRWAKENDDRQAALWDD